MEITDQTRADPQAAGLNPEAVERLVGAFQGLIDERRLPGAAMLIVRRGVVGCLRTVGRRDPMSEAPMALDSIFRIYSMTKPVVSLATLMLLERAQLLLSDPVAKYIPAFADIKVGIERTPSVRPFTVQDLLRHTAGLTYEIFEPNDINRMYIQAGVDSMDLSNQEFVEKLASVPLMYQPGYVWEYSRATDVLGRLIEVLSDCPLDEYLRENIFKPLGMRDTAFYVPDVKHGRIAEPYAADPDTGDAVRLLNIRKPPRMHMGGGGLVSTLPDYTRFVQMLANGGSLGGVRLIGRKTHELMTSDHLNGMRPTSDLLPPGYGFGLGVAVRTMSGVASMPGSVGAYHWGGIAGTLFFVDPAEQLYAIVMMQAPGQRDEFRARFRNLVYATLD